MLSDHQINYSNFSNQTIILLPIVENKINQFVARTVASLSNNQAHIGKIWLLMVPY